MQNKSAAYKRGQTWACSAIVNLSLSLADIERQCDEGSAFNTSESARDFDCGARDFAFGYFKTARPHDKSAEPTDIHTEKTVLRAAQASIQKPVTQYRIAAADTTFALAEKVNNLLQEGWECQGGISVTVNSSDSDWYYQALVHRNLEQK